MRVVEAGICEGGVIAGLNEPTVRERGGIGQVLDIERRRAVLPLSATGGEGEHQNCGSKPETLARCAAAMREYCALFWGMQAASRDSVSPYHPADAAFQSVFEGTGTGRLLAPAPATPEEQGYEEEEGGSGGDAS